MGMSVDQILSNKKEKDELVGAYAKSLFFSNLGLGTNGIGYAVVFGWNDPDREDKIRELRSQGFRWNGLLKAWICRCPSVCVDSCRIDFNELVEYGWDKAYHFKDMAQTLLVEQYVKQNNPIDNGDGFYGSIGERVSLVLKLTGSTTVRSASDFGDFEVLYFKDDAGHNFSWFQRTYSVDTVKLFMKKQKVTTLDVIGTVKKQITRCGVKMNDLTRCEISAKGKLLHDFAVAMRGTENGRTERKRGN